ncbi:MAG: galactokinase family protein [Gemmatimonadota bacterium]
MAEDSRARLQALCRKALAIAGPGALELFVPGRIEFLGKHTDYAGGRSLVCAIERGFCFVARPRRDRQVVVHDAVSGDSVTLPLSASLVVPPGSWKVYPGTVARRLARNFPAMSTGADIGFASNLPPAAGLSSSSALITGCLVILYRLNQLESGALSTPERMAEYASCVENGRDYGPLAGDAGVGTLGGSQDHASIMLSEPGRLLQCGFLPLRREDSLPLPLGYTFAVATSGVAAEKTGATKEAYNRMARVAGQVIAVAREITGGASLFEAVRRDPEQESRIRRRISADTTGEFEPGELLGRFEQMMLEATVLVPDAAHALRMGDLDALGATVELSQMLAERLLGNQIPETSALVQMARSAGAAAASAFGAGFGGSVWALIEEAGGAEFLAEWKREYETRFPARSAASQFFLTRAGPPLTIL